MPLRPFVACCALLLGACAATPSVARAQERPVPPPPPAPAPAPAPAAPAPPRSIHVTGTGEARATPDEAYVELAVETQGKSAQEAAQQNARRMEAVVGALVKAGVAREALETRTYHLFPEFAPEPPPRPVDSAPKPPRIVGYRATNSVQLRTRELAQLGRYIDEALGAGANRVDGVRFALSNPQEAQGRALAEAVKRARAAAQAIAAALGVGLGAVLEASSSAEPPPFYPVPMAAKGREAMMDAPTTPITPAEQTVNASVSLRFAIEGG